MTTTQYLFIIISSKSLGWLSQYLSQYYWLTPLKADGVIGWENWFKQPVPCIVQSEAAASMWLAYGVLWWWYEENCHWTCVCVGGNGPDLTWVSVKKKHLVSISVLSSPSERENCWLYTDWSLMNCIYNPQMICSFISHGVLIYVSYIHTFSIKQSATRHHVHYSHFEMVLKLSFQANNGEHK